MTRRLKTALVIDILILLGLAGLALADEPSYGRVSLLEGDAYILREGETDWDFCDQNMIVVGGDLMSTETGSRLEVQFASGSILRLGASSRVTIEELWLDEYNDQEVGVILVERGKVMLTVRDVGSEDAYFTLRTTTAALHVESDSRVRLDVKSSGFSRIFVYYGSAQLRTDREVVYLSEDERVEVDESGDIVYLGQRPDADDFEHWCDHWDAEYVTVYAGHASYHYAVGYYDLRHCGRWKYVWPHGWVWVPYVEVGWRPYHHGRWVYRNCFGWVWISYEPWGWIPYRYGRWTYAMGFGWIWIPGDVWGPGWVAWFYGPGWVCWTPLDPWDYPLYNIYVGMNVVNVWTSATRSTFIRGNIRPKPYRGHRKPPTYEPHPGGKPSSAGWYTEGPGRKLDAFEPEKNSRTFSSKSYSDSPTYKNASIPTSKSEGSSTYRTGGASKVEPSTLGSTSPTSPRTKGSPTRTQGSSEKSSPSPSSRTKGNTKGSDGVEKIRTPSPQDPAKPDGSIRDANPSKGSSGSSTYESSSPSKTQKKKSKPTSSKRSNPTSGKGTASSILGFVKSAVEGFVREAKPSDGSNGHEPEKMSTRSGERKTKGSSTAPKKVFDRPSVKAR